MVNVADPFGLVGQVLDGQFRVDKLVGEGGFSAVYRGHHQGLNEPIAIKSLKLPSSLGPSLVDTFVQRFRDESRILYRLSQGNLHIVRSIAAGTTQSPSTGLLVPYMVLEWLEGRSVQNDFTVRRTLGQTGRSLDVILKLFETAADGLAYAHAQGVVHRDLNPGNLFLAQTQQGLKMKVLDFGVAKLMHDGALDMGPRQHTVGQIKIFAPAYGAPEQFDDRIGKVGAFSDVYSFALILLEALRDKGINEGQHIGEFAAAACDPNMRPTPRAYGVDIPDEVEAAFARATRLDPKERWQTVGDFWQSLVIANKVATERRYETAARETPPLAMNPDAKATVKQPTAAFTMPLGATTAGLPPGVAGAGGGPPRPRMPTTIGIPAPAGPRAPSSPGMNAVSAPNRPPSRTDVPAVPDRPDRPISRPNMPAAPARPPSRPAFPVTQPATPAGALGQTVGAPPGAAPAPLPAPLPARTANAMASTIAMGAMPGLRTDARTAAMAAVGVATTEVGPPPSSRRTSSIPTSQGPSPTGPADGSVIELSSMEPMPEDEDENEATKVHAPAPEMLRTLAFHDAANARAQVAARIAKEQAERDAEANRLAEAARSAPAKPPYVDPNADDDGPPDSGGTLILAPVARAALVSQVAQPQPGHPAPHAPHEEPAPQRRPASLSSTMAMASPLAPPPGYAPERAAPAPHAKVDPSDWGAPTQAMAAVPMPPVQAAPGMQGIAGAHGTPPHGMLAVTSPLASPYAQGQHPSQQQPSQQQPSQQQPSQQQPSQQQSYGAPPRQASSPQLAPQQPQAASGFGAPVDQGFPPPPSVAQPAGPPKQALPIVPIAIVLAVLAVGGLVLGGLALRARHPTPAPMASSDVPGASLTPVPVAVPVETASAAPTVTAPPPATDEADAAPAVVEVNDAAATAAPAPTTTATATTAPAATTTGGPFPSPPAPTFGGPVAVPPPPKPSADPNAFSESAARGRLSQANGVLAFCKHDGGVTGPGNASVTFGPDGSVTGVAVDPPYAGTKEGDCVASQFRRAKVNAFVGSPQTVRFAFEVPK